MDEVVDRLSADLLLHAKRTSENNPIYSIPVAYTMDRNLLQELLDLIRELIRYLTEVTKMALDRFLDRNNANRLNHYLYVAISIVGPMAIATIQQGTWTRWEVVRLPAHATDDIIVTK